MFGWFKRKRRTPDTDTRHLRSGTRNGYPVQVVDDQSNAQDNMIAYVYLRNGKGWTYVDDLDGDLQRILQVNVPIKRIPMSINYVSPARPATDAPVVIPLIIDDDDSFSTAAAIALTGADFVNSGQREEDDSTPARNDFSFTDNPHFVQAEVDNSTDASSVYDAASSNDVGSGDSGGDSGGSDGGDSGGGDSGGSD